MPSSFAGIVLTVLALTVEVKLQSDFNLTCTSPWTDGAVANSECVIPRAKFSDKTVGGLCDIYSDTVVFTLTKADGNYSRCTVTKFDTICNASVNADGCGCRDISGGNIIIDYNITAVRADHQGAQIKCEPQCLDSNGFATILTASTANDCFNISVASPTSPGQEPDLLFLLFLLLLIPIAVVIIIVWYCFCHNGGINATKKAEGGELESLPQDQQATNGNKPADGNGSGQRDNKVGTGHVATNGTS